MVCNEPSDATKNGRKRPLEVLRVDNGAEHKTRLALCRHSSLVENAFSMLETFLLHSTPTDQDVTAHSC